VRKLFYPPFHKNLLSFNINDYVSFCGGGKARDWSIGLFAFRDDPILQQNRDLMDKYE
jgi:hypothetical protein